MVDSSCGFVGWFWFGLDEAFRDELLENGID